MKLRLLGKKADLSLSINAIVVLILAITMLGLGLAFLRGTFTKTTAQFAEVSDTVKSQISDEIKASGEKLYVRGVPEIDVKKGETKEIFYGIKNVLSQEATFTITAGCTRSIGAPTTPPTKIHLNTFPDQLVKSGETAVLTMNLVIDSDAVPDTYSCFTSLSDKAGTAGNVYDQKDFFVKVTT